MNHQRYISILVVCLFKSVAAISRQNLNTCFSIFQCGVGIVFASDGSGGLFVKGFVPRSTAAKSGKIQELDLLVKVDGTDVHRWPVSEIAPLMLGPAGSSVTLGFLRRYTSGNESGQAIDDLSSNGSMKSKVPKLWKQGDTPRNEAARSDFAQMIDMFLLFL
jgi:hypothetical protein